MKKLNNSLKNADGSYSGKVIAGLISLLIVLTQQLFAAFGIKFTGDWNAIAAIVNTVLTILGILGVVSGGGVVEAEAEAPVKVTQVSDTTKQLK
ncbi:holin [Weissella paramesenteroides]|nr:holin [Weissella paramesenteroides]KAA8443055.1 holin [Weissella paramesenteroides]KAA8444595.1 holin [Weissella paramesenteroides]KAA8448261.1 holin [Weissella paramesenteroides]KAA8452250.1 holin [Weissella paramesenteroides]